MGCASSQPGVGLDPNTIFFRWIAFKLKLGSNQTPESHSPEERGKMGRVENERYGSSRQPIRKDPQKGHEREREIERRTRGRGRSETTDRS